MDTLTALEPLYISAHEKGKLKAKAREAQDLYRCCCLCPHRCRVNRLEGEEGFCSAGKKAVVASVSPHFGEEKVLVGRRGSGTIFFSHCVLACDFCQNWELSQAYQGNRVSPEELADFMLRLQARGCHNINLVSPTQFVPSILSALSIAVEKGLRLPLVYNSGGYEEIATLKLLEGIVDIYMPDFKFWQEDLAQRLTRSPGYPLKARLALKEMHRQVGDLIINDQGIAVRGLLLRHLVMPQGLKDSEEIFRFVAREISPHTFINVMGQYHPAHRVTDDPLLGRRLKPEELEEALALAQEMGLSRAAQY